MKVSVLQFFSWPDRRVRLDEIYRRALERIDVMDRTGYDAIWLAEHHFTGYSVCPSVHLMGMHVADRTTNLRIGMAVTLAGFYHPLRVAEEVALLDVLSGGRVNWGAGRGFDPTEHRVFGVEPEESYPRFREHVEIIRQAWTSDRLNFKGRYWQFDDIEVLPKPAQLPHPPIWLASTSPEAIAWSAENGYSILIDPHSSHDSVAEKIQTYEKLLIEAGHSPDNRELPVARLIAIAPTRDEAEAVARRGAQWMVGSYVGQKSIQSPSMPGHATVDPVERYLDEVVVWGTPAEVRDKLLELRDRLPLDHLICAPLSNATFGFFTDEVLPHVR